ncbi:MAG: UDP-N-acetylmuramoyl-L-alanine--D-glutamate ligase [Elusimicrobia bacterium]|nr:UDP-N-acetylmuramoyl-L-alanine--D-glutamate ligase [Elusimicrobiota bacterium]
MFKPTEFINKKALIIGAGKSGISCANLLISKGFDVLLTEQKKLNKKSGIFKKLNRKVELETGGHSENIFSCGFAVKSPGIPNSNSVIKKLKKKNISVFSEIEIALAFIKGAKIFAVTGTNGKTTTVTLLNDIFRQALKKSKHKTWACGNLGTPVSLIANKVKPGDFLAMEISSYQLEDSSYIKPNVSSILNITPDHVKHHGSLKIYIRAKTKIFKFQNKNDFCILNYADKNKFSKSKTSTKKLFFSIAAKSKTNAYLKNETVYFKLVPPMAGSYNTLKFLYINLGNKKIKLRPPKLYGLHNIENSMTAALMAVAGGIKAKSVQKAFDNFKGVKHRIQPIRVLRGVKFINDSKATNINSVMAALKALAEPKKNILLILGGKDKGSSYKPLAPLIQKHIKCILTIGEAALKIEKELKNASTIISAKTMDTAIKTAFRKAEKNDIVLLSPACASFDQFKNFEDRGETFIKMVKKLK